MHCKQAVRTSLWLLLITNAACGSDEEAQEGSATEQAEIAGFGEGEVTGSVSFAATASGIEVTVSLKDCPDGAHPVHIHEGTSCADAEAQGPHWGPGGVRGEGIPNVTCSGGQGTVHYQNTSTAADKVWTLDGDATTNPVGHAFVVHEEGGARIGCGVIEAR